MAEPCPPPPPYHEVVTEFGEDVATSPSRRFAAAVPPRAPPTAPPPEPTSYQTSNLTMPSMTEEQVRSHLETYVDNGCCYGKDSATQMSIRDISRIPVFRYKLETSTEKRSGSWKTVPYEGPQMNIIGRIPTGSQPQNLWEVMAAPDVRFTKSKKSYEIADSVSIYHCPRCRGSGRIQCSSCGGSGSTPCSSCSGTGHTIGTAGLESERCTWCFGQGRSNCSRCHRSGVRTCSTCEGSFRVKSYFQLQVNWNYATEYSIIVDGDVNSPYRKHFQRLDGIRTAASQCSTWAQALDTFPDQGVQLASRSMLEWTTRQHQNSGQRIIEFRQTVEEIPATKVIYSLKGKEDLFFITGLGNRVYFPNSYPGNCCCTIL